MCAACYSEAYSLFCIGKLEPLQQRHSDMSFGFASGPTVHTFASFASDQLGAIVPIALALVHALLKAILEHRRDRTMAKFAQVLAW
jgi:hypothetical protein